MLTCDDYITPGSLREAFAAMEAHRGRYRIVAGATDTLPWAREGRAGNVHIPALIDVAKIPELREISVDDTAGTAWRRHANPALPRRSCARPRLAGHAALRGVVCRRSNPRAGDHRRQYRQCLAGGRRHALPDRA